MSYFLPQKCTVPVIMVFGVSCILVAVAAVAAVAAGVPETAGLMGVTLRRLLPAWDVVSTLTPA